MEVDDKTAVNCLEKLQFTGIRWRIFLCLYFPLGVLLAIIRTFMLLQVYVAAVIFSSNFYVKSFILRIMAAVLGVIVLEDKSDSNCIVNRGILVSNHESILDFMPIHLLTNCLWPVICTVPDGFINCIGLKQLSPNKEVTEDYIARTIKDYLKYNNSLILVFPEQDTSGSNALSKFPSWWIDCEVPIQPITVRIWRPPFANIARRIVRSTWYSDVLWTFFVPFSIYIVKYLPVLTEEFVDEQAMVSRIQSVITRELETDLSNSSSVQDVQ